MWSGFEDSAPTISRDDFVKVQARVEMYRNRAQLILERLRRAEPAEVDFADFFAHTTANVDELWARLRAHVSEISILRCATLVDSVLDDPEIAERYKRAPAAKTMHHAYLGGLLEHVVSLCDLARNVAAHYPEADRDFLITGAVLHDVAKIYEMSYDHGIGYTTEGQLLGHIVMAVEMVGRKMDAIPEFPPELANLVKHLILSHHGKYEFGSPKLPMFREAVMLHYLDDLDSKMAAIRSILASENGEAEWTDRSGALERQNFARRAVHEYGRAEVRMCRRQTHWELQSLRSNCHWLRTTTTISGRFLQDSRGARKPMPPARLSPVLRDGVGDGYPGPRGRQLEEQSNENRSLIWRRSNSIA